MIFLVTDNIIIQVYKILLSCLNFVKIILKKVQFLFCLCCVDTMIQLSVMTQNRTAGKSSQKCSPVEAGSVVYPWWSGKKSSTKKDPPHSAMSDCQANIPHAFWLSERLKWFLWKPYPQLLHSITTLSWPLVIFMYSVNPLPLSFTLL